MPGGECGWLRVAGVIVALSLAVLLVIFSPCRSGFSEMLLWPTDTFQAQSDTILT
jgi:hypothetical protein